MIYVNFWIMKLYCHLFQVADILNLYQTWQLLFCITAIIHCLIFHLILTCSSLKTGFEMKLYLFMWDRHISLEKLVSLDLSGILQDSHIVAVSYYSTLTSRSTTGFLSFPDVVLRRQLFRKHCEKQRIPIKTCL